MRPLGPGKCDHHEMSITDGCLHVLGTMRRAKVNSRPARKLLVSSLLDLPIDSLAVLQVCQISRDGSDYNFRGGVEAGAGLVAGLAYEQLLSSHLLI